MYSNTDTMTLVYFIYLYWRTTLFIFHPQKSHKDLILPQKKEDSPQFHLWTRVHTIPFRNQSVMTKDEWPYLWHWAGIYWRPVLLKASVSTPLTLHSPRDKSHTVLKSKAAHVYVFQCKELLAISSMMQQFLRVTYEKVWKYSWSKLHSVGEYGHAV